LEAPLLKHLANIISISRIVLLLSLFFTIHHALLFTVIYLACGLSDVLDGYIARKTNTASELGARLDSFADFVFFAALTGFVMLWMKNDILVFLPWIIAIIIIRLGNLSITVLKYHTLSILHTWGNKLTGFLIFIAPLFILYRQYAVLWLVCMMALLSAAEETIIHITSKELHVNRRSIFKI
jgi:CDP-diacylglycerol--glycerol-3-phosphate 3-phosphatidyltransferase